MQILFEKDYATITYEADLKLLTLSWKRFVSSQEYRIAFSAVLKSIEEKRIPLFLADTRKQGIISPTDRKWLESEMIPPALKVGLKYVATLLNKDIFKKYYLSKIKEHSENSGMSAFEMFDDYDKARAWLLSKNTL